MLNKIYEQFCNKDKVLKNIRYIECTQSRDQKTYCMNLCLHIRNVFIIFIHAYTIYYC